MSDVPGPDSNFDIDVFLLPEGDPDPTRLSGRVAVVVDVLRASTTVVQALRSGAIGVVSFPGLEAARHASRNAPAGTTLLAGERGGIPPEGFDIGNSPREYTSARVAGKTVHLTTTNGTIALDRAQSADVVLWGCFRNASTVARYIVGHGRCRAVLVCAGSNGEFSLEDALAAGMIVSYVCEGSKAGPLSLSDSAEAVRLLYRQAAGALLDIVATTCHARHLVDIGFGDDLPFCCEVNADDGCLPLLRDGVTRLFPSPES